ncbi:matrix protein [Carpione rhabdovirus]|nr:matrix protein [Carpione rhabdovirus]
MPFLKKSKKVILIPPVHLTYKDEDRVLVVQTAGVLTVTGVVPANHVDKLCLSMKLAGSILGSDSHPAFFPLVQIFSGSMEFGASVEKLDFTTRQTKVVTTYKLQKEKAVALASHPTDKRVEERCYTAKIKKGSITYVGSFLFSADHVGSRDNRESLAKSNGLRESQEVARAKEIYASHLDSDEKSTARK